MRLAPASTSEAPLQPDELNRACTALAALPMGRFGCGATAYTQQHHFLLPTYTLPSPPGATCT